MGAGEGRNAIFLAEKGFDVTAVDVSKEGIKKLNKIVVKRKIKVNTLISDIKDFIFYNKYDIILALAVLHFLNKKDIKGVIEKIKANTNKNGLNVISVFTEENPDKNFLYLFKKGELKSYYKNWDVLYYKEFVGHLEKHGKNGKLHRHGVASLIARKN